MAVWGAACSDCWFCFGPAPRPFDARSRDRRGGPSACAMPELPDHPVLAGAAIAGFDPRLRASGSGEDVEALAAVRIDDLVVIVIPLLRDSPVAWVQFDERSRRRSSPGNVDTLAARSGRSDALYRRTYEIPHLGKGRVARIGLYRVKVARQPASIIEAHAAYSRSIREHGSMSG